MKAVDVRSVFALMRLTGRRGFGRCGDVQGVREQKPEGSISADVDLAADVRE
jgi:hypothetical protein